MSRRSDETNIALIQSELERVNARIKVLEEKTATTTAILNKWGGGIAVGIILFGALWGVIVAFGGNLKKAFGPG